MADRETIIATGNDGSSSVVIAIVVLVIVAIGAYFLFFNRPVATGGTQVNIEAPAVTVPAAQAPAETPAPAAN